MRIVQGGDLECFGVGGSGPQAFAVEEVGPQRQKRIDWTEAKRVVSLKEINARGDRLAGVSSLDDHFELSGVVGPQRLAHLSGCQGQQEARDEQSADRPLPL